jgi:hypothetical protein
LSLLVALFLSYVHVTISRIFLQLSMPRHSMPIAQFLTIHRRLTTHIIAVKRVKYSYNVELRGDRYATAVAFALPVNEIRPQGVEFVSMVLTGMKERRYCGCSL